MCAPAALPADRILTTPAGTTSLISSPRRNVVRGVEGAVLTTIVLPAHKAGAILLQAMKTGAFHGTTAATTPSGRSEEHTSELQSLMRISYAVFCLEKKTLKIHYNISNIITQNTR